MDISSITFRMCQFGRDGRSFVSTAGLISRDTSFPGPYSRLPVDAGVRDRVQVQHPQDLMPLRVGNVQTTVRWGEAQVVLVGNLGGTVMSRSVIIQKINYK